MRAFLTKKSQPADVQDANHPIVFAHKNPKYKRANGEFLTRKLRSELDRPLRIKEACTKRFNSLLETEIPRSVKLKMRSAKSGRKKRKRSKSFMLKSIFFYCHQNETSKKTNA